MQSRWILWLWLWLSRLCLWLVAVGGRVPTVSAAAHGSVVISLTWQRCKGRGLDRYDCRAVIVICGLDVGHVVACFWQRLALRQSGLERCVEYGTSASACPWRSAIERCIEQRQGLQTLYSGQNSDGAPFWAMVGGLEDEAIDDVPGGAGCGSRLPLAYRD
jgi:hypothetical protein